MRKSKSLKKALRKAGLTTHDLKLAYYDQVDLRVPEAVFHNDMLAIICKMRGVHCGYVFNRDCVVMVR